MYYFTIRGSPTKFDSIFSTNACLSSRNNPGIEDISQNSNEHSNTCRSASTRIKNGYAVAGLVTLGWEDMCAYVAAAEAENVPIILQQYHHVGNILLYLF